MSASRSPNRLTKYSATLNPCESLWGVSGKARLSRDKRRRSGRVAESSPHYRHTRAVLVGGRLYGQMVNSGHPRNLYHYFIIGLTIKAIFVLDPALRARSLFRSWRPQLTHGPLRRFCSRAALRPTQKPDPDAHPSWRPVVSRKPARSTHTHTHTHTHVGRWRSNRDRRSSGTLNECLGYESESGYAEIEIFKSKLEQHCGAGASAKTATIVWNNRRRPTQV